MRLAALHNDQSRTSVVIDMLVSREPGESMGALQDWDGTDHVVDRFKTVMTEFECSDHVTPTGIRLDVAWQSELPA